MRPGRLCPLMLLPSLFFTAPVLAAAANAAEADDAAGSRDRPGWRLVWADEFEGAGLPDPQKWSYERGFIRNRELQYYTVEREENARVEGGALVITARKEAYPNPDYEPDARRWTRRREHAAYTSASLTTRGKAAWTYGRIEVRAKLPTGRGTWPAIWMLGTNIREVGWPACGEIDIMENVGFEPRIVHANIHTEAYNHVRGTNKGDRIELEAPWERFHIYAVEWTAERMDFFVDGRRYFIYEKAADAGEAEWPFDQPFYLILNLAIGGGWGGQRGIDDSIFPQRYEIDYVRVYQKP